MPAWRRENRGIVSVAALCDFVEEPRGLFRYRKPRNLTISGSTSGYGVLVVTGNLILNGDFTWHGLVLVIGAALTTENGGGQGQITGSMYVGNTSGAASTFTWNGGGGNGIQYDHCWADDLLSKFPPNASDQPLQVLSTRMLEY